MAGGNKHDKDDRRDRVKRILIFLLIMPCFFLRAYADDLLEYSAEIFETDRLESGLSEEEKSISGSPKLDGSYDVGGAIRRLWNSFIHKAYDELRSNLKYGAALIGIALCCAFGSSICRGGSIAEYIELLGACAAAAFLINGVDSIVTETVDAMYRLSDYSKAALPVVFTAAAAGGAAGSAGVKFAAVSFALDVLMSISQKLIIPAVYAYIALTTSNAVFPNAILSGMSRLTKWAAATLMSGSTIAFTAYMSVTGVMSTAVDAAAVKTTRTLISNTLPIVGGMISDASAMILSAAGIVRSCTGAFGLMAVCVICAGPFAVLSIKMLVIKAAAVVSESIQCGRMSSLLNGISGAISLLMGLLGCCGIMLFISITAGMKAVAGL